MRKFVDIWQNNIYLSTADTLDVATLQALLAQCPVDRILFGGNYPWDDECSRLVNALRDSGVMETEDWEKLAWKNADRLFGLKINNSGYRGGLRPTATRRSVSYA